MNKPELIPELKEMMKNAFNQLPSRDRTDLFGLGVACAGIGGLLYLFLHRK